MHNNHVSIFDLQVRHHLEAGSATLRNYFRHQTGYDASLNYQSPH